MAETRVLPPSSKPPTVTARTDVNAVERTRAPKEESMERENGGKRQNLFETASMPPINSHIQHSFDA